MKRMMDDPSRDDLSGDHEQNRTPESVVNGWWVSAAALAASAVLRFLAHPPLQVPVTIWVALVGYFVFFNRVERWRDLLVGTWLWGFVFFLPGIFWIRHVSVFAWLGLSAISAGFPLVFAVLLRWVRPRPGVLQVIAAAAAWLVSEYVQTHFLSGFPYLFLSHSQAEVTPLIQIAEITGAWGVSAIIVLVNGALYLVAEHIWRARVEQGSPSNSWVRVAGFVACVFVLLGGCLTYGYWRLGSLTTKKGPSIGVLQGNIPQTIKNQSHTADQIFQRYYGLAKTAADRADLIVWPETMFPYPVLKVGRQKRVSEPARLQQLVHHTSVPQIIGVRTIEGRGEERSDYNSAWLVTAEGRLDQMYAKHHLVPFGEYVPGQFLIPGLRDWMSDLLPVPEAMWLDAGPHPARSPLMDWNGWKLAPMICYEVVFPGEVRANAQKGADLIVNMSNEAWYKNEAELDQMLSIVRFRSVEHRLTTVRATNTGISGFVFPDGRARLLHSKQGRDRGFQGVMVDRPRIREGRTVYTRYGNWLIWAGGLLLLVLFSTGSRSKKVRQGGPAA